MDPILHSLRNRKLTRVGTTEVAVPVAAGAIGVWGTAVATPLAGWRGLGFGSAMFEYQATAVWCAGPVVHGDGAASQVDVTMSTRLHPKI
jgi:hypothetical protein